jgi:hypothetical protein
LVEIYSFHCSAEIPKLTPHYRARRFERVIMQNSGGLKERAITARKKALSASAAAGWS